MYVLAKKQKFTANVVVGLLGNKSLDSNRFILVAPKPENGVRLQAKLENQNLTKNFVEQSENHEQVKANSDK